MHLIGGSLTGLVHYHGGKHGDMQAGAGAVVESYVLIHGEERDGEGREKIRERDAGSGVD